MTLQEDGKNYGDFLLKTIDTVKEQFTEDEFKLLKGEAEKIRDIENKLTMIEKKYPDTAQKSSDDDMSMPSDNGSTGNFPSFEGKDLDGNEIKSDELFSGNADVYKRQNQCSKYAAGNFTCNFGGISAVEFLKGGYYVFMNNIKIRLITARCV